VRGAGALAETAPPAAARRQTRLEEQAAALRRAKGSNLPLDWENLAEELES